MSRVVVEFKAGKLALDGKVLKADPRKGQVKVVKGEDELTYVQWHERTADGPKPDAEDSFVVFPDECHLEQIPNGRTYVLKFQHERDRDMFFWMQEPKTEADAGLVANFNDAINGRGFEAAATAPPASAPTTSSAASGAGQSSNLASILGQALAAAQASASSAPVPNTEQLAASLLARLAAQGGVAGGRGLMRHMVEDRGPSLGDVLRPEVISPLLQEPGTLERLAPHLPEQHRSQAALLATVSSAQFRQQLASFSMALQTGQLDLGQFGLQAKGFSVADFLEAIQDMVERQKRAGGGPSGMQQ